MGAEFARTLRDGRAGFPGLLEAAEAHLEDSGVPPGAAAQLMIALDEVISNALSHGGNGAPPVVGVRVDVAAGTVTVEVSDDGGAFDPLSVPPPDTTLSVEDRPIGGLGIHFLRELMSEVSYRRENRRNCLRFSKTYPLP